MRQRETGAISFLCILLLLQVCVNILEIGVPDTYHAFRDVCSELFLRSPVRMQLEASSETTIIGFLGQIEVLPGRLDENPGHGLQSRCVLARGTGLKRAKAGNCWSGEG